MSPKRPRYDYAAMSFDEAIEHFFGRGVPLGSPSQIKTQQQLNEALQGHRSNIATPSRKAVWLANDITAYLMLHGHKEYDIKPTRYEESWSRHQQKYGTTSHLLLWRIKSTLLIEKLKKLFYRERR